MTIKTKAEILSRAEDTTDVVDLSDGASLKVRALLDHEFSKAQTRLLKGQSFEAKPKTTTNGEGQETGEIEMSMDDSVVQMDLSSLIEAEFEARLYVASCGLSVDGESWTIEEVRSIPIPGAVSTISDAVLELGGHDLFEGLEKRVSRKVKSFRKE